MPERVWSLSPFFNEVDVLEIRLAELDPVVDVFVLVEARQTHTGEDRRLVWPEVSPRFEPWRHKIRYLPIDFPPGLTNWGRENFHREALGAALKGIADDDLVLVSDVDEVPRASTVTAMLGPGKLPCHVSFPIHPYCLNWIWDDLEEGCCRCTFIRASDLTPRGDGFYMGVQAAINPSFCAFTEERACRGHCHLTGDYGWHFTYQGGAEAIVDKANSIADDEVKGITIEDARNAVDLGIDPFGRNRKSVRIGLSSLPLHVQKNPRRFAHMLTALPAEAPL